MLLSLLFFESILVVVAMTMWLLFRGKASSLVVPKNLPPPNEKSWSMRSFGVLAIIQTISVFVVILAIHISTW